MTKITKKSSKKAVIFIALAIALIAVLSFGGTFAWFTATTTKKTGSFTTGHVKLGSTAVTLESSKTGVLPGDELLPATAGFKVTTTDSKGNYVAMKITVTATKAGEAGDISNIEDVVNLEEALGSKWFASEAYPGLYVYGTGDDALLAVMNDGDATLAAALVFDAEDNWSEDTVANSEKSLMGATIKIEIQAVSVQVSNLDKGVPDEGTTAAEVALKALAGKLNVKKAGAGA